jgi:hypothetical protein
MLILPPASDDENRIHDIAERSGIGRSCAGFKTAGKKYVAQQFVIFLKNWLANNVSGGLPCAANSHTWRLSKLQTINRSALGAFALFTAFFGSTAGASNIKTVFVIAMENHNWTQPANQFTGSIQQIYMNPNAPFINSLVNGTGFVAIDGAVVNISSQVSYATAYHNVLATPGGNNPHIHPSEPNYIWAEGGSNFGVLNDNDPYTGGTNQNTAQHLSAFLTQAGRTWRS